MRNYRPAITVGTSTLFSYKFYIHIILDKTSFQCQLNQIVDVLIQTNRFWFFWYGVSSDTVHPPFLAENHEKLLKQHELKKKSQKLQAYVPVNKYTIVYYFNLQRNDSCCCCRRQFHRSCIQAHAHTYTHTHPIFDILKYSKRLEHKAQRPRVMLANLQGQAKNPNDTFSSSFFPQLFAVLL